MNVSEQTHQSGSRIAANRVAIAAGGCVSVLVTLLYFSLYWNRFAGLRSGNGSYQGGIAILSGILPYRDFFTSGPPLNPILSALVLEIFGRDMIVIRAFGVFERVLLVLLLYFWLARLFRASDAALASIVAIVVSTGDNSNNLSSYGYEAILFFLSSAYTAVLAFDRSRLLARFSLLAVASGLLAALSFATKQTLGVGATLAIPLMAVVFLLRLGDIRKAALFLGCFALGWSAGAGALLIWLADIGVLREFLTDVFKKGPSAKASHPSDFAVRAAHAAYALRWGFLIACAGLAACWSLLRKAGIDSERYDTAPWTVWIALLSSISIACGAAIAYADKWPVRSLPDYTIYFGSIGAALLVLRYLWLLARGKLTDREAQLCLLAGTSLGISFMLSLSWPALFDMVFPAFGLVIAMALDQAPRWGRMMLFGICSLTLMATTSNKLNRPHAFHEWADPPVRLSNTPSTVPQLRGLLLPETTVRFIDGTVRIIKENSKPNDRIFVYPELGVFYTLTHRLYPTQTDSHNIDVVNDEFARSEAARLLANKPAVLVYFETPEWSLRADEKLWRHGERSGQRDLIAAIETLVKSYRLAGTFDASPNDFKVMVYVRQ